MKEWEKSHSFSYICTMSLDEEKAVYTFIGKVSMVHEILAKAWEIGTLDSSYNPIVVALQSSLEQIKYALNHE